MSELDSPDNEQIPDYIPPFGTSEPIDNASSPKTERPALSGWRRALRLLLGILIVFGIGSLLVIFTLYIPLRQAVSEANKKLLEASQEHETELEKARQEIDRLSEFEATNQSLEEELSKAILQVNILQLKYDIVATQYALAVNDVDRAFLALSQTEETLEALEKLLPQNQLGIVEDLMTRLELVLDGLENDLFAAKSDLDVMMASLLNLEDALFH